TKVDTEGSDAVAGSLQTPVFDVGSITLTGIGGMMGTSIDAADVGPITISGGFGFLSSQINSNGSSVIDGVTTTGYGIRDSQFTGGAQTNRLIATGTGKRLDSNFFTSS